MEKKAVGFVDASSPANTSKRKKKNETRPAVVLPKKDHFGSRLEIRIKVNMNHPLSVGPFAVILGLEVPTRSKLIMVFFSLTLGSSPSMK
jgi:hypothetical protein